MVDVKIAVPVESTDAVPKFVEPLEKTTEPVGNIELETAETFAMNSTGRPCVELEEEAESATVLGESGFATARLFAADVDAANAALPPYCAVMLCVPTANEVPDHVAWAEAFKVDEPRLVVPS